MMRMEYIVDLIEEWESLRNFEPYEILNNNFGEFDRLIAFVEAVRQYKEIMRGEDEDSDSR